MNKLHEAVPADNVNKATVQILEILNHCAQADSVGITEISRELGISKSMASRALRTLLQFGLVVRDRVDSRYTLGFAALCLRGDFSEQQIDIRETCAPFMQRIHELTGESVFLSVILGQNHITIDSVEAHGVRVRRQPIGLLVPLHASPASRALLAFLSDEEIEEYIRVASPLKRFTASTITDPALLWKEIELVRASRVARGYGDHYDNATYVAFPILDAVGRPHAAITLGAPANRLSNDDVELLLPELEIIIDELRKEAEIFYADLQVFFG